jgi:hypothetical protein
MKYEKSVIMILFAILIALLMGVNNLQQTVLKQKYEKQLKSSKRNTRMQP